MSGVSVLTFVTYMNPLIRTRKDMGAYGIIEESTDRTAELIGLSDEQLEVLHNPGKSAQTEFEY